MPRMKITLGGDTLLPQACPDFDGADGCDVLVALDGPGKLGLFVCAASECPLLTDRMSGKEHEA